MKGTYTTGDNELAIVMELLKIHAMSHATPVPPQPAVNVTQ